MKKIVVILTGGTIAMEGTNNSSNINNDSNNVQTITEKISSNIDLEIIDFIKVPSPHITPTIMFDLTCLINSSIERSDVDGIVVTHGTDTVEETVFLSNLLVDSEKPIVFTGSMKTKDQIGFDGEANIYNSILVASDDNTANYGTVLVANGEIHSANDVIKTSSVSIDTFKSVEFGPVGIVDDGIVSFHRIIVKSKRFKINNLRSDVSLIKAYTGMKSELIKFVVDSGVDGIVIEAFGRGNIPNDMIEGILYAKEKNVVIVITTRCYRGKVHSTYSYPGGGKDLIDKGVILGNYLSGVKARLKLMVLLEIDRDFNFIKDNI